MPEQPESDQPPAMQKWFDNIFLLLALSILISGLMYNFWGLLNALTVPLAK